MDMPLSSHTGVEPGAKQMTLFDLEPSKPPLPDPDAATAVEGQEDDFITKDIISLSDVPITILSNISDLEVTVTDNGVSRVVTKRGQILRRKGPHPSLSMDGGEIKHRDEHAPSIGKPVMADIITTVIYEQGDMAPIHKDVLSVLIGLWRKRFVETGKSDGMVHTTSAEIIKCMRLGANNRSRQSVKEALHVLSGIHITKSYEIDPELDPEGKFRKTEFLGSFITNFEYKPGGTDREGVLIEAELNPALVRSLNGDMTKRQWILRGFNLTTNMSYKTDWKRILANMVEARLERGDFKMPLFELWRDCLGGSEEDIKDRRKLARVRERIKEVFEGFVEKGWVQNFAMGVPDFRVTKEATTPRMRVEVMCGFGSKTTVSGVVEAPERNYTPESGGWIYCERGPTFGAGLSKGKGSLARVIAKKTTETNGQADALMKGVGADFIMDVAYKRLLKILDIVGEDFLRLPLPLWFEDGFPIPERDYVVERYDALIRKEDGVRHARPRLVAKRDALAMTTMQKRFRKGEELIEHYYEVDGTLKAMGTSGDQGARNVSVEHAEHEVGRCLDVAITMYMEGEGLSRTMLSTSRRRLDDNLVRAYRRMCPIVSEVALASAGHILYLKTLGNVPAIAEIPRTSEMRKSRKYDLQHAEAALRWPEAMKIVGLMQQSDRHPWETHVGAILERRIVELVADDDFISQKSEGRQ